MTRLRVRKQSAAILAGLVIPSVCLVGAASAAPSKWESYRLPLSTEVTQATEMVADFTVHQASASLNSLARRPNGRIAYQAYIHHYPEVFTVRRDGTHTQRLTHNFEMSDGSPSWSPTGGRIAYFHKGNIFTMKFDGSEKQRLTRSDAIDVYPAWSPSGKRIVFARLILGEDFELFTISRDGSDRQRLTRDGVDQNHPEWSPTGRKIAYDAPDGHDEEIYTIRPNGSGVSQVTHNASDDWAPSYSPSGRWITFTGGKADGEIFVKKLNSQGRHQVTHNKRNDVYPSWSPNGRRIAFPQTNDANTNADIYTISVHGGDRHQVTNTPHRYEDLPDWGPHRG